MRATLPPVPDLRERKKQRTRDRVIHTALELFAERGFDATTIADIADAADIAPRTFFAYFDAKEAVVFHDFDEVRSAFAERLRCRDPEETAFDALRAWVAGWLAARDGMGQHERERRSLIRRTPALQVRDQANHAIFERLLSERVGEDLDLPADSLRPRMVSAAAIAALTALEHLTDEDHLEPERAMALVDEALAFLEAGLDGLRRRRPIT